MVSLSNHVANLDGVEHTSANRRCYGHGIANPRIKYGVAMTKWVCMSTMFVLTTISAGAVYLQFTVIIRHRHFQLVSSFGGHDHGRRCSRVPVLICHCEEHSRSW